MFSQLALCILHCHHHPLPTISNLLKFSPLSFIF
jgi:hypothetical protein